MTARAVEPRLDAAPPVEPGRLPLVLLVGNPNVGKTALFNRLSGESARVANYPGVTVERTSAVLRLDGRRVELVDLPGCYSLAARSREELIAIQALLGLGEHPPPALAIVVVDAGQLARGLYLVLQLVELGVPTLVALNMIDEVASDPPAAAAVADLFGVPCVATSARTGAGIAELRAAIRDALETPPRGHVELPYPPALAADVEAVSRALPAGWRASPERDRALARWALGSSEPDDELGLEPALRAACARALAGAGARDIDHELVATRWAWLDGIMPRLRRRVDPHPPKRPVSERIDRVLLHPVLGFLIFVALMLVVFQALFAWADPMIGVIESLIARLQGLARGALPAGVPREALADGVIGGVGNVVVFLPQILLLFLFIGLLEDTGYMARVAYLMDRVMRTLGLNGRAFVPMLSGFACAVPAILATRTMERQRDRLLTMLVVPLMTCSARLPVYTLIIAALFPPSDAFGWMPVQALLMVAMYLLAVVLTLGAAAVLGRTVARGRRIPLILELPPYRMPALGAILRSMLARARVFVTEAGTVILAVTLILWALLHFPRLPEPAPDAPPAVAATQRAAQLEHSVAGRVGKAIEPAIAPLGFDWKIGVGLIGAFAAREVFVSTMALVYAAPESDEETRALRARMRAEARADGRPVYTPLAGLSLMIFFAIACQCTSTLAVVRRETRSWRWPAFLFGYTAVLAWLASFAVYQGGKLLGF